MGVVLYRLLVGSLPIDPNVQMDVLAIYTGRQALPSSRTGRPDLPEAVHAVLGEALAFDASSRFVDAGQMLTAMQATWPALAESEVGESRVVPAKPDEAVEEPPEASGRAGRGRHIMLAVLILFVGALVPILMQGSGSEKAASKAETRASGGGVTLNEASPKAPVPSATGSPSSAKVRSKGKASKAPSADVRLQTDERVVTPPPPRPEPCPAGTTRCSGTCRPAGECPPKTKRAAQTQLDAAVAGMKALPFSGRSYRGSLKRLQKEAWKTSDVAQRVSALGRARAHAKAFEGIDDAKLAGFDTLVVVAARLDAHVGSPPVSPSFPSVPYPSYDKPTYQGIWRLSGRFEGPMDAGGIIVKRRGKYYHVENARKPNTYYKIRIKGYVRNVNRTTYLRLGVLANRRAKVVRLSDKWTYKRDKRVYKQHVKRLKRDYKDAKRHYRQVHKEYDKAMRTHRKALKAHRKLTRIMKKAVAVALKAALSSK
jgi:hypothetical protein